MVIVRFVLHKSGKMPYSISLMTGAEIKHIRLSLGLSAKKAAKKLGVHQRTIWRWESRASLAKRMSWIEKVLRS
jgi:DNA-binding transcriptional regulator YiaG